MLQDLTGKNFSSSAFPWLSGQEIEIGNSTVHAIRVNFVGELGWELHHPIEEQNTLFDMLFDFGKKYDLKPFGIRAMDSLRLEKSYRLIPRELSIEYSALESGLERFVDQSRDNFTGKVGLQEWQEKGFKWRFVTLEVFEIKDTDPRGSEPIYADSQLVGRCTSGGYGWRVGKSLALGMIESKYSELNTKLEIEILGERFPAKVIAESPFDPKNERLRE